MRVIPPKFDYFAPTTIDEAVDLLDRFGGEAKVLAGGQSLLPLLKLRLAEPRALVDLSRIRELTDLREDGDHLRIGAMVRTNELDRSGLIRERYPILSDAAHVIADPLVRNMGTVGGNVSHGDPANDLPACMIALGAAYVAQGPKGARTIPADTFYLDTFLTVLESNEIVTEIRIPRVHAGQGTAYVKLERQIGDFPIVGVAANLGLGADGNVSTAALALTAVGPTAIDARQAAARLVGRRAGDAELNEAANLARDLARPVSDLRGSAEYKRAMVRLHARKALVKARDRARGSMG